MLFNLHMTTIISISVLASFASGFLCLLVVGIKWASLVKRELIGEEHAVNISRIICARCGTSFFDNPQLGLKDVLCADCKWPVCSACALRYPFLWLCTACIKSRDKIVEQGECCLKDLRQRFLTDQTPRKYGKRESEVRNLIELLSEKALGIGFEDVIIKNLSNDIPYLEFMEKYEGVLSLTLTRLKTSLQLIIDGVASMADDTPNNIEKQLRTLIQEIIVDASNIEFTKINNLKCNMKFNIASKTYEEILSIAILNKIVENVTSLALEPRSKAILPVSATMESRNSEREYMNNIQLEAKIKELSNSSSRKNSFNKSQIIFPDLGFDFPQVKLSGSTWEDNWLFRRKNTRMISSNKTDYRKNTFVPMFVPSPNNNIRPQIGEDFVDDISDLSDLSDSEIEQLIDNASI